MDERRSCFRCPPLRTLRKFLKLLDSPCIP